MTSADWTDEDQAAAEDRGWNVFEQLDGSFRIEREYDQKAFLTDKIAEASVTMAADRGDALAIKALAFVRAIQRRKAA